MSLIPVPPGKLATIVTSLEMTVRPDMVHVPDCDLSLVRLNGCNPHRYRALFRAVGTPYLWFSRLLLDDDALAAIIHDDRVELYAVVDGDGTDVGMLELDFREAGACELAFVGLVEAHTGKGFGHWLMAEALTRAWREDVSRVWLHSCTLDHPGALSFYRKSGFIPFERAIEIAPDPRITGHLPRDAATQVPLIE